jgi:hypothetical protein
MEYETVSARLTRRQVTELRVLCERRGTTFSELLRQLVLKELKSTQPHNLAGRNLISYNKDKDSFGWFIQLDGDQLEEVMKDVSPEFLEDLYKIIFLARDERRNYLKQKKDDSVPVPSSLFKKGEDYE